MIHDIYGLKCSIYLSVGFFLVCISNSMRIGYEDQVLSGV